mmetsp:Transcript_399/g.1221  ORF Transcript_399/g.1221 Transcript_399/m.1221 type:complete len:251 (-) Transcript_399:11-763(-)
MEDEVLHHRGATATPHKEAPPCGARTRKKPRRFHETLLPDVPPSKWTDLGGLPRRGEEEEEEEEEPLAAKPTKKKAKRHIVAMERCGNETISRLLGGHASLRSSELLGSVRRLTLRAMPTLEEKHVDFVLAEPGVATFVAHSREAGTVACLSLRRAASSLFQISFVAVDPRWRRRRLGTRLVDRAIRHARQYRVLYVAAYADHAALDFFQARGFTPAHDLSSSLLGTLDHYTDSTLVVKPTAQHPRAPPP